MYGVIFDFLRDYVIEHHGGKPTWETLLKASGQSVHKIYFPVTEYPDEEIVAIAKIAAEALSLPLPAVLEDFGIYTGKKLMTFYHMYVADNRWKTFDIIEHAGKSIHHYVHKHNPMRKPPQLTGERVSENELIIHYHSARMMCPVVKGIVQGLARHFGEDFTIEETQCMYHGAKECTFRVTRKLH